MKYLFIFLSFLYLNVLAIEPNEILEDGDLEKIAVEISKELRCLVCQNEDIHNSNADIAKDLIPKLIAKDYQITAHYSSNSANIKKLKKKYNKIKFIKQNFYKINKKNLNKFLKN